MASPNLTPGPEACRTENDDPTGDLTRPDPRSAVGIGVSRTGSEPIQTEPAAWQDVGSLWPDCNGSAPATFCATQASLTKRGYRSKGRFSEIGVGDVVRPIEKVGVSLRLPVARLDRARGLRPPGARQPRRPPPPRAPPPRPCRSRRRLRSRSRPTARGRA